MPVDYTTRSILDCFDHSHDTPYGSFINLNHPYQYLVGCRVTLFRDDHRWAMVGEKYDYNPRGGCVGISLFYFGNCLDNLNRSGASNQFINNVHYVYLIDGQEMAKIEEMERVIGGVESVRLRSTDLRIPRESSEYSKHGITLENGEIRIQDLGRILFAVNPDFFRATNEELRTSIPADLPFLTRVDEWHHRDFSCYHGRIRGDLPSSYETYPMLADCLVSGDGSRYVPTLAPNTHWKNWPESGSM